MLDKVRYFIARALRNMRQWPFLCAASILTMSVALAAVATFFLVVLNVQQMSSRWSEDLQIVAYLEKSLSAHQLSEIVGTIKAYQEVSSVRHISQKEAMRLFRDRLGSDADLLEGVQDNILPASLEISLKSNFRNKQAMAQVVQRLEMQLDIGDIRYGQEWLERFDSFIVVLKIVGLVLGSFLLFAALFIVSNTIKLTLYARRDELEIMALVGATARFIKIPFLLEGAFQGLLGGLFALLSLSLLFKMILGHLLQAFWLSPAGFNLIFLNVNQQVVLVCAGVLLGMFGSLASLRKLVQI